MSGADHLPKDSRRLVNGARVVRREIQAMRRKMIPGLPAPAADDDPNAHVKREAYAIAKSRLGKSWARRYLRQIARGYR